MEKIPGKRITSLSRVDQERLDRGEISYPEEALRQYDAPTPRPSDSSTAHKSRQSSCDRDQALTAFEKDILANVPPHFGAL